MTSDRDGIRVHRDKLVAPEEFAGLLAALGWGVEADYEPAVVRRSIDAYPFVAHARAMRIPARLLRGSTQ